MTYHAINTGECVIFTGNGWKATAIDPNSKYDVTCFVKRENGGNGGMAGLDDVIVAPEKPDDGTVDTSKMSPQEKKDYWNQVAVDKMNELLKKHGLK